MIVESLSERTFSLRGLFPVASERGVRGEGVFLLVALLILLSASIAVASPFASPRGYAMDIPAGWGLSAPNPDLDVVLIGPKYHTTPKLLSTKASPTIAVVVTAIKDGVSNKEALAAARASAETDLRSTYPGFAKSADGIDALGSLTGYFIEGGFDDKGFGAHVTLRRMIAAGGHNLFTLTEMSLDDDFPVLRPTFEAVESSFALAPFDTSAYTSRLGFQVTPPGGWGWVEETPPDVVTFIENVDEGEYPASVLIRARNGLAQGVDEQLIADNRDEWNAKYSQRPGYAPVDQGTMLVGGEKAFFTEWSETADPPVKRVRKWHVLYPRNGVIVEVFATYPESSHRKYDLVMRDLLHSWVWCPPKPVVAPVPAPAVKP
ncbi:MAG: LpqN/LpqT family lipoprotein [Capsulimonadaceae bacterium]|nr:LpqN/LpqT family lipoprotein [Capsulimonadaceae bacterium]